MPRPSFIDNWRFNHPREAGGRTDREIAMMLLASDSSLVFRVPELKRYKDQVESIQDRSNGSPLDRHTVAAVQKQINRPKKERGAWDAYVSDPFKRGLISAKMADIIMDPLVPKKGFSREDIASLVQFEKELKAMPISDEMRDYYEANGFMAAASELLGWKETVPLAFEIITESLAARISHGWSRAGAGAAMGAGMGLVGGPLAEVTVPAGAAMGATVGFAKASHNIASTMKYMEQFREIAGADVFDNPERAYDLINDAEKMAEARAKAFKMGLPVAILDGFSMGLAGRFMDVGKTLATKTATMAASLPKTGVVNAAARLGLMGGSKIAPIAVEVGAQGLGGMTGEGAGQVWSEGSITDWKSVFLEGVAEFGMAPLSMTKARLTKEITPDYSKALNRLIKVRRRRGLSADQQKMGVDAQFDEGELTAENAEVYKQHIDILYDAEHRGVTPENEEGASEPSKDRAENLKALNSLIESEFAGEAARAPEPAPRKEAAKPAPTAAPRLNLFFAKSKDTLSAYKRADGKEKAGLEKRDIDDGGVDVVDSRDKDSVRRHGKYEMAYDPQSVMVAVGERIDEAELGEMGGTPTRMQDLHKANEASDNLLGHKEKVQSIIDQVGADTEAADAIYPYTVAVANVIAKAGESLNEEQQQLLTNFADRLDASRAQAEPEVIEGDIDAPFAKKKDTGTMDMFAATEADAIRSKAAGRVRGPAQLGEAGTLMEGDPIIGEAAAMEEFAEGEHKKWLKDGEHYVTSDGNVYKAVTDGADTLVGKIPKEGELTQAELKGFKQTDVSPLDREIAKREQESLKRIEAAMETDPAEFALEGEDIRDIKPSRGGERGSGRTGLYSPFEKADFDLNDYGLFAVPSEAFGKRWNQRDPKNPKKFEKISYIEGLRRAAARLATNFKFSRGNIAEDWAWASLVGGTPRRTYRGYDPASPERTGESVGEPIKGVLQKIQDRVKEHTDEGRSSLDEAVLYNTKAKGGGAFAGKQLLVQNFRDMEKAHLREKARIGSGMQRTKTSGKRLTKKERKRQEREKAPVAGGVRRQSGGTAWPVTIGEVMETQSERAERQRAEEARLSITRRPELVFTGEEFAEAEEGIEDIDLTKFDQMIDDYHFGSADLARTPKNIVSAEATKLSVRKFLQDFMSMLHAESPRATHRESWPEFSRDRLNDEIYKDVLIVNWVIAKEKQIAKAKDLPGVKEQIESVGTEVARLDNTLRELNGKALNQIISRINYATSAVRAGTLYTEEALAEEARLDVEAGVEPMTPETMVIHHSVIDSHVERYLEAGLLPENAKVEIHVKQGSPHEMEAVGRPEKKVTHKKGTWGRSRKGWEKGSWVSRRSDLYVKEIKARAKILAAEMNRLKVQERKLEHILSLEPMNKRNNLYQKMRDEIKVIFTKRNVAAKKHNSQLEDPTQRIDDGSEAEYGGRESAFRYKSSEFSDHNLSLMLYGRPPSEKRKRFKIERGLGTLKPSGVVGAIDRVMNQMLVFGEFSTKEDVRSAFQEVALFSKQGGKRGVPYVDMLTQNSLVRFGKGMGDMSVGDAFDAAYLPLKGEDRARAERFHPLIRKFIKSDKYNTRVHLANIDSAVAGAGFYDQINDQIVIDPTQIEDDAEVFDILTEEFMHSILSEVKFNDMALERLEKLMDIARAELDNRPDHPLSGNRYFLSNVDEFIAHAFLDDDVASFLNSIDLGDEALSSKGMFESILEIIKQALGLTAKEGTVLEEVLLHAHKAAAVRQEGRRFRFAGNLTHGFGNALKIPLKQFKNDLLYTRNIIVAEGSGFVLDPETRVDGTQKVDVGRLNPRFLNNVRAIFTAALHGTPFAGKIEQFSTEFIGEGEGHAMAGWGLYFTDNKGVAEWYRDKLSSKKWSRPSKATHKGQRADEIAAHALAKETTSLDGLEVAYILEYLDDELSSNYRLSPHHQARATDEAIDGLVPTLRANVAAGEEGGVLPSGHPRAGEKVLVKDVHFYNNKSVLGEVIGGIKDQRKVERKAELRLESWKRAKVVGKKIKLPKHPKALMKTLVNAEISQKALDWLDAKIDEKGLSVLAEDVRSRKVSDPAGAYKEAARKVIESELSLPVVPKVEMGKVYEVELAPKADEYLLWDKPRAEQSGKVSKALDDIENELGELLPVNLRTGRDAYHAVSNVMAERLGDPDPLAMEKPRTTMQAKKAASLLMLKHGIRGNKFRGQGGQGGFNYVIFDAGDVEIRASWARRKRKAGEGQTELQFGEEQQELSLGLETTPSEDKPLFAQGKEAKPPAVLAGAIKRRNIDWGSRRLGIDEGLFLPSSKPITRENVQEIFDRQDTSDNARDYGYGEGRLTRAEAEAAVRRLPDNVGVEELRRYLINDTRVATKEEALRQFEGMRRDREQFRSDLRLALSVVEGEDQMALFAQRGDEVELTQGEIETKVRQLKDQLFPDQIVTDEAALESVEANWDVATDEDAQSYNVPSGINKAHLGKAVQYTHDRVFVEKAYNMMVRLNPELGEIKIPQFDPLEIDHPMFAGVRAEGQPPTTTAIEMWEADIVLGALSDFPLSDIKAFVRGDRVHSDVGRFVAPKSQYAGKPTPAIEEGAFQPKGTGEVSAKSVGKLVAGEDQMALFAERKEYKAGNISGAEVNDIIAAKLVIPSREKTRLENAMTKSDKFYESLVSESHVLSVESRLIFEDKVGDTKPDVDLAKVHELQRGTAPMADLDTQELEFAMDGLIGTNKKTRELFDTFITNIRIKSRLEDQSRTVTRSKARIAQFYEKDAKGNLLHWTVDEHGNPEELDMTDPEFTRGKSRLELEMELFDIINYSKEVAPWKNIEEARPDLQRGMEDLVEKLNDPEMLSINEFGITEGKFVEAGERFGQAMEESLFRQFKSGVIKWDHFHRLNSNSGLYFPFYVIKYFSRNPEDTFGKTIKGIRDIGETILKPMEAAKLSLYYSRMRSERNVFMQELDNFRKDHDPDGKFISRVADPEAEGVAGKDSVMFYEDGEKKYLLVDGRIADLLKRFDPVSLSQTSLAMKLAGDLFKMGATGVNVFFQVFNFGMFDPIRLLTTSKAGLRMRDKGLNPFVLAQQYIRAIMASSWANLAPNSIRNLIKKSKPGLTEGWDKLYREFVDSGAAGSTIAEYFHKPTSVKDTLTGSDKARRNPFTAINAKASLIGKTLEQVSKIVGFQRMKVFEGIEELKVKIDKTKDVETRMRLERELKKKLDIAATEVRNYAGSPDFLRQGSLTKAEMLNVVFIFFNARVQGVERDLNRLSKVFSKDAQERGLALGVGMKIGTFAVVPTLWTWSMHRRDKDREDDYDEVSENDKKHYFHIPLDEKFEHPYIEGKMVADYIRIPRRETFGLFSYTIEKALDWMYDKDPNAVNEMIAYWLEGSLPLSTEGLTEGDLVRAGESVMSNLNPLMKVLPEILTNRNFYRHRPIVPLSMANADASEQYFESTPEIYKDIGNLSGLGALRVKHLAEGISAGMFTQLSPAKNVGIPDETGSMPIGRTIASTPLIHRLARSTYIDPTELDEIMNDEKKEDATARVLRRRKVNKFMEDTRGMTIQGRVMAMKPPQNQNEHLVNQSIIRRLRERALGLDSDEIRLKNSSSFVRASVIIRKLQGKSPAQVKVYLTDLARKKILTPAVGLYIREQLQSRGETMLDYITEPVR